MTKTKTFIHLRNANEDFKWRLFIEIENFLSLQWQLHNNYS